jgi:1,4-alpha-glucan branching enzyme
MNFKLNLVLNAHLPFVRHPEANMFFEETWLFEAIDETYLPLLRVFHRLEEKNIPFKLTMSLSPTLVSMLADKLLQERYRRYLDNKIELGRKEIQRTKGTVEQQLAQMYLDQFEQNKHDFNEIYVGNILKGFQYFQKSGHLDLITSLASYPFAPLYQAYPKNIRGQLQLAIETHYQYFGSEPAGIWLAENGFYPGLDAIIAKTRIKFVFLAVHGVLLGEPRPNHGVLQPIRTPAGLVGFARHLASSNDVWDKDYGYPSDPVYREFYRDIGYDLPLDYIKPYLYSGDNPSSTGYKYYRITGKTNQKEYYNPEAALLKVKEHASNFLYNRRQTVERLQKAGHKFEPIFNIPLDAELFGHWWFEGVNWLEELFTQAQDMPQVEFVRPVDLALDASYQTVSPIFSSWGTGGFAEVWLDGANDWIYRHTYRVIDRFFELVRRFPDETGRRERALNQAAREMVLAQASDWPLMLKMGVTIDYAQRRIKEHISNFNQIYDSLSGNKLDTEWLTTLEKKNNIFPRLDYRIFS